MNTVSDMRERHVDVGAGHGLQVLHAEPVRHLGQQVDRQHVHEVEEEHPREDRERERRDHLAVVAEALLHRGVDEVDEELDEALEALRHPGGPALRAASQNEPANSTASSTEKNTLSQWTTLKSMMPFGSWFFRNVR